MKTAMILGLLTSSLLVSGASAMEAMDGAMMHTDTMMTTSSTGAMMKKDAMMKDDSVMMNSNKMSLMAIVKHNGYNWSKDRKKLAIMAGIKNYRGTLKQNLMIRAYLLSDNGMQDVMMNKEMMKKDTMMNDTMTK